MLPVMGKYISDLVEGKSLDPMVKEAWKWRPDKKSRDQRWGGDGKTRDLNDMDGWKAGKPKEELLVLPKESKL
jgi:hypothetical protein